MPNRIYGYALLTLAMITVGTTVIASKIIAHVLPPFTATALRFAIALPIFIVIVTVARAEWPRFSGRQWGLIVLQAGAGSVGYTVLLISGLRWIAASDAGVIIGILPAVSALFSVVVLGERLSTRTSGAVGLATIGVLAVVWSDTTPQSIIGSLLIVGAVVCESVFILLYKRLDAPVSPLVLSTLMAGFGLVLALPVAIVEWPQVKLTPDALWAVAYYAVVPTVAGFIFWYAGAARVKGAEAAVFTAVAPVTALVLSAAVLAEPIGESQLAGATAVVVAIFVLALRPSSNGARRDVD